MPYPSHRALQVVWIPTEGSPMLEIHLANNVAMVSQGFTDTSLRKSQFVRVCIKIIVERGEAWEQLMQ